jgi:hypothetical protein
MDPSGDLVHVAVAVLHHRAAVTVKLIRWRLDDLRSGVDRTLVGGSKHIEQRGVGRLKTDDIICTIGRFGPGL